MFAVIKTGGKQYRVAKDDEITVERLPGDAGDSVTLDHVLMLGGDKTALGTPTVDGAAVVAEVVEQSRNDKIVVFKKKRRHGYRRTAGHRQPVTVLKITDILTDGAKPKKAAAKKAEKPAAEKPKAEESKAEAPKAEAQKAETKAAEAPKKAEAKADAAPAEAPKFLDAPQGDPDDLKKISGVGPALEKKLHGLGIYHFWQVAEFTADDIARVDDYLSFKGRIERDNWVEQAKTFAAEKDS
ncbi:MAG: 50S ribosomal protein L21 [Pseudomonadota bacterium]